MSNEPTDRSIVLSSPTCNGSAFIKPLAVLLGAAVIGSVAFLGDAASQFRNIFLDLNAKLPAATSAIVEAPFMVYLVAGAILGVLAAGTVWGTKSKVHAVLIATSTVVAVIVLWIGVAVMLMSPIIAAIRA